MKEQARLQSLCSCHTISANWFPALWPSYGKLFFSLYVLVGRWVVFCGTYWRVSANSFCVWCVCCLLSSFNLIFIMWTVVVLKVHHFGIDCPVDARIPAAAAVPWTHHSCGALEWLYLSLRSCHWFPHLRDLLSLLITDQGTARPWSTTGARDSKICAVRDELCSLFVETSPWLRFHSRIQLQLW